MTNLLTRVRFPHPLVLLSGAVFLAAAASWVLPAGVYDRTVDEATGRTVVVSGTFHAVEPAPVGPFDALVAMPRGMIHAAEIIFLVFLIGGAFTVVDHSGVLRRGVGWLVGRLGDRRILVIPIVAVLFATGGALENMQEEIIALLPVLLVLTNRLGYRPMVAVAMSLGAAVVGSAFSPINPFQVGIAQKLAELPLLSGGGFRMVFLALALGLWITVVMGMARATATGSGPSEADVVDDPLTRRDGLILGLVASTFGVLVWGILTQGWGFNHMSGLFFGMGILAGAVAGMGVAGTGDAFARGFRDMALAALLIGFARAIFVVLEDGRIVDTLVHAMVTPLEGLPTLASALGMVGAQIAIHFPVPSLSGQAVLTMPVLVPLSDLLGLSRQVTVLAFQYGAGLTDLIIPTSGSLMAILALAKVPYEDWIRWVIPIWGMLVLLGAVAIAAAIAIGL
ncbi:MAG: YfcC family protein [Longimicrobiales bacterium]